MAESPPPASPHEPPLVASVCGTFLKPEMLSIYRQITGLRRFKTRVFTEERRNEAAFPFEPVETLTKLPRPKPRGNFLLRFWFKYVRKQWPPPFRIEKDVEPYLPYDLLPRLEKLQPALVHVYYGHKAWTYRTILERCPCPFVVSFHGVDVARLASAGPADKEAYLELLLRARLILGRSQSLLNALAAEGVPEALLRLNRTPIPLKYVPHAIRQPPSDGRWRLVQACRLIEKKGILTTLQALAILRQEFPKFTFSICGSGPAGNGIRSAIRDLDLEDHVQLEGWVDQIGLRKQFDRAHLFLHPSETTAEGDREGIPNAMLEAMASGLPVVATVHGGIPEAVLHARNGWLVPERSPHDLAAALKRFFTGLEPLPAYSISARHSVLENFDAERQIAALEDAYTEAIGREARG